MEQFLEAHYSEYFVGKGHENKCSDFENPIIIIRDPFDRFLSIFYYWKYGATAGPYQREDDWRPDCESPGHFIAKLRAHEEIKLSHTFTEGFHFAEQHDWIRERDFNRTIVLKYSSNLDESMHTLFRLLRINDNKISLPYVNKTRGKQAYCFTEDDKQWIQSAYEKDIRLWDLINRCPKRFKKVI